MPILNHLQLSKFKLFANTYINFFEESLNNFTLLFPDLNLSFLNLLKDDLQGLIQLESDIELSAIISELVESKLNKEIFGRKQLQSLFNYTIIAFDDKTKVNDFGKKEYSKSAYATFRLVELLSNAAVTAEIPANKAILNAAGFSDAAIAAIKTTSEELIDLQDQIHIAQANRKDTTARRNKLIDTIWSKLELINKASKVVFDGNPAKINRFLLYK